MNRAIAFSLLTAVTSVPCLAQDTVQRELEFTVRIENVSTPQTLKLSNGDTAPAPTAPVLWVVHTADDPLFTDGKADRREGLESLAEDGNPEQLAKSLKSKKGIVGVGAVAVPEGASEPGPILPGNAYELTFVASPGQRLTVAMMFGQSNDLFYAPHGKGIRLFDERGAPLRGDITAELVLWDAGTEINQEPGLGPDQAPRQSGPNTGAAERGVVRPVHDTFSYPKVGHVLQVTVSARPVMVGRR